MLLSQTMAAKARVKQSYHHGDLARALVTSALEIIAEEGPEALTLRHAASRVGVTHAAAYRHFADKTALLAAVAEEGYRLLAAQFRAAVAPGPRGARARVKAIGLAYVEFALERPAHFRVMSGPRLNEDGRFPALEAAIAQAVDVLVAELKAGQAEGIFIPRRTTDLGISTWIMAHGFAELVLRRRIKVKSNKVALEYFEKLFDPLLDGITV